MSEETREEEDVGADVGADLCSKSNLPKPTTQCAGYSQSTHFSKEAKSPTYLSEEAESPTHVSEEAQFHCL